MYVFLRISAKEQAVATQEGEQAWAAFRTDEFSLVITDWMMPGLDGLELVQRIRQDERPEDESPRYVFVILLTTKSQKDDLIRGMQAGSDDFKNVLWPHHDKQRSQL